MPVEIPLECGRRALVSIEDAFLVRGYRWRARSSGQRLYVCSPDGNRHMLMHRLIMRAARGQIVDHINGNGLDNTRGNLRFATGAENSANRMRSATSRSPFKGVHMVRPDRFHAQIAGRRIGIFATVEEAALCYDAAARERFGAFAAVNFPRPGERSAVTGEIAPAHTGGAA